MSVSSRSPASGSATSFRRLPQAPRFHKPRRRLADTIELLAAQFASRCLGWRDDLVVVDSTPVECARSLETVRRRRSATFDLVARVERHGPLTLIGDKGYTSREFTDRMRERQALIVRPRRKDEPGQGPHVAAIRQRIESIGLHHQLDRPSRSLIPYHA